MRSLVYKRFCSDAGAFRLILRNCLDGLRQMRETHRFRRGIVAWVGYRRSRFLTSTPRGLRANHKMLAFAWTAATSFSILPLRIIMTFGLVVTLFGAEEAVRAVLAHVFHWYTVRGWTELIVVVSVIGGTMLMSI